MSDITEKLRKFYSDEIPDYILDIAPIAYLSSIMRRGILSHSLADRIDDHSVAMQEIQEWHPVEAGLVTTSGATNQLEYKLL